MPMMTYVIYLMILMGIMTLWTHLYTLWPDVKRVSLWVCQKVVSWTYTTARPVSQHKYHYTNRRH